MLYKHLRVEHMKKVFESWKILSWNFILPVLREEAELQTGWEGKVFYLSLSLKAVKLLVTLHEITNHANQPHDQILFPMNAFGSANNLTYLGLNLVAGSMLCPLAL